MPAAAFAVVHGRVVHEAGPPIDQSTLGEVEAAIGRPVPDELRDLWGTCFGGRLDYEYSATFSTGGPSHALACRELFGTAGGFGPRSLLEWIEAERAAAATLAADQGQSPPAELRFVPFGGFGEYERFFVDTEPGPDHGSVWVWSHALSPAVTGSTEPSGVARVANDLPSFFAGFYLSALLEESPDKRPVGRDLRRALDELASAGVAEQAAADQLWAQHQSAALDWRAALAEGSFASDPRLLAPAIIAIARTDDHERLGSLLEQASFADLNQPTVRGGNALDHAAANGASRCIERLIATGVDLSRSVVWGAAALTSAELARCLDGGAAVTTVAVTASVSNPDPSALLTLAHALVQREPAERATLVAALQQRADDDASFADDLDAGTAASRRGDAASFRATAQRLRSLAANL